MKNYNENTEKEKVFYSVLEENKIVSYLTDEIHPKEVINKAIENGCIVVNEELWQHLLSLGQAEIRKETEDRVYTIEDKELFSEVVIPTVDLGVIPPSEIERIQAMENLLKELMLNESDS